MKIGIISDIHANLAALEAVLAEMGKIGISLIFNGGDSVGYSPFPNECLELLRKKKVRSIRGNYDEAVANGSDSCGCPFGGDMHKKCIQNGSLNWTIQNVSTKNKEYLLSLPNHISLETSAGILALVHTDMDDLELWITKNSTDDILRMADQFMADILVMGHIHEQYMVSVNGIIAINPGAVGRPFDGDPRAAFATITIEDGEIFPELHRVEYDVEANCTALLQTGLPPQIAGALRNGSDEYE